MSSGIELMDSVLSIGAGTYLALRTSYIFDLILKLSRSLMAVPIWSESSSSSVSCDYLTGLKMFIVEGLGWGEKCKGLMLSSYSIVEDKSFW